VVKRNHLFQLHGLDVFGYSVQPDFSPVLIGVDLMEDRSPDRHLASAVSDGADLRSVDVFLDVLVGEPSASSLLDQGQILSRLLQRGRGGPVASSV